MNARILTISNKYESYIEQKVWKQYSLSFLAYLCIDKIKFT